MDSAIITQITNSALENHWMRRDACENSKYKYMSLAWKSISKCDLKKLQVEKAETNLPKLR